MTRNRNLARPQSFCCSAPQDVEDWFRREFTLPYRGVVEARFATYVLPNNRYIQIFSPVEVPSGEERVFACRFAVPAPYGGLLFCEGAKLERQFRLSTESACLYDQNKSFYKNGKIVQGVTIPELASIVCNIEMLSPFPQHAYPNHSSESIARPIFGVPWRQGLRRIHRLGLQTP